MNTSNKFTSTRDSFLTSCTSLFGDRILFFCTTGSTARLQNVTSWSDIDIILVLDSVTPDDLTAIQSIIKSISSEIKIGTTTYSHQDIVHKHIDPKTHNMFQNIQNGKYSPQINSIGIGTTMTLEYSEILQANRVEFYKDMHILRREIMKDSDLDEQKTYKTLTYLIRVLLFHKHHWVDGYFETWNKATEIGLIPETSKLFPDDILKNPSRKTERIALYRQLYTLTEESSMQILHQA